MNYLLVTSKENNSNTSIIFYALFKRYCLTGNSRLQVTLVESSTPVTITRSAPRIEQMKRIFCMF